MTVVGFTGTRKGMTLRQRQVFWQLLQLTEPEVLHHGCCEGADEEAHRMSIFVKGTKRHLHPPIDTRHRCKRYIDMQLTAQHEEEPADYHERNHAIVDACDVLVATPDGPERLRSGTWATVRYARKIGKPVVVLDP